MPTSIVGCFDYSIAVPNIDKFLVASLLRIVRDLSGTPKGKLPAFPREHTPRLLGDVAFQD